MFSSRHLVQRLFRVPYFGEGGWKRGGDVGKIYARSFRTSCAVWEEEGDAKVDEAVEEEVVREEIPAYEGPEGVMGASEFEDAAKRLLLDKISRDREAEELPIPPRKGTREDGTYYHGQWENMHGPPYRQARTPLPPIRSLPERQIPELRGSAEGRAASFMLDILEHEAYATRFRDEHSGGAFADGTIAEFDAYSEEDAFYNEFLTEDELFFPEDWSPRAHVPDTVRQQIYFLWTHRKMSLPELARKFRLRTERVSGILALKRTEAAEIRRGTWTDRIEKAMTEMSASESKPYDANWESDHDQGLATVTLPDAHLPKDAVPRMKWRGDALRIGVHMPRIPQMPKPDRTFQSAVAFRDIGAGDRGHRAKRATHLIAHVDGKRKQASPTQELYRSGRPRRFALRRP